MKNFSTEPGNLPEETPKIPQEAPPNNIPREPNPKIPEKLGNRPL